ncbi:MAG: hypothetical protein IT381_27435 [Deltaproteobacteria bacterium]|nr:hypothetical protein [Deltaproteobacteria bacterium]
MEYTKKNGGGFAHGMTGKSEKTEAEFSEAELLELQKKHKEGITSADLIALLDSKGFRFSESTLRKYVQLGLLPRSRRIGRKGQRRGSIGIYPPNIILHILNIKRGLKENRTLDEIGYRASVLAELETLSNAFANLASGMKTLVAQEKDPKAVDKIETQLKLAEQDFERLHKRLTSAIHHAQQGDRE